MAVRELKEFNFISRELYFRGRGWVMAQSLSMAEAKEEHLHIYDLLCEDNNISIYRILQRQGVLLA